MFFLIILYESMHSRKGRHTKVINKILKILKGDLFYPKQTIDIYVKNVMCPTKKMAALKSQLFN